MRSGNGEQSEVLTDEQMTVSSQPPLPHDNTAPISEPPATSLPSGELLAAPRQRRRVSLMATLAGFVIVLTLLILFTDAGRSSAGTTARIHPTPTVTPSPTATVIPSPTAMPGFKVYTDVPNGFIMQYPDNWTVSPNVPGVEFDESGNQSSYTVQVFVPGDGITPGSAGNADDASAWVQYEMDRLATVPGTLQRQTGPIPAKTIGGQVWQSGIARLSQDASVIRVQVYATVYQGKPYIINVNAVDDRFATGSLRFFEPMLSSFQFLLPTP